MKLKPNAPRYEVVDNPKRRSLRGKDRPLRLTPEHPARGWSRALGGVFLTTLLPTALLWWWTLSMSSYHVAFTSPVSDVRLDGQPIRLNYRNAFELPRFPLTVRHLNYRDAVGQDVEVALQPGLLDDDAKTLTLGAGTATGYPNAEFVKRS